MKELDNINMLEWLRDWYESNCDGDWMLELSMNIWKIFMKQKNYLRIQLSGISG